MQGNSHTPNWYIIDVTELFTVYCSPRSVQIAISYLGDLTTLTDLCCYIAILQLRGFDTDIPRLITEYIATDVQNNQTPSIITKVVNAYTTLLRDRFVYSGLFGKPIDILNHVEIKDVVEVTPDVTSGDIPLCVSIRILANFRWNDYRIEYEP